MRKTRRAKANFAVEGRLRVYAVNRQTGTRRKLVDDQNQVTNLHLTNLGELVTQQAAIDPVELAVHSLWIESSATALPAATAADVGAAGIVVKRAVFDRATDVDADLGGTPGLCQFRATLEADEANGSTIRAAGLYTRGDDDDPVLSTGTRLVCREVFAGIAKTSLIVLDFEWDVQYSIG